MHLAWHAWPERNVKLIVTKSHDVENSSSLLDRYYKLGNAFADYAAKRVTQHAGLVEFQQTRRSAWRYLDKMKESWKQFFLFDYGISQIFIDAVHEHKQTLDLSEPQPDDTMTETPCTLNEKIGLNALLIQDRASTLQFIDWFDLGDPLHRRRRMSMYGATYFRCLFAFLLTIEWKPLHKPEEFTTFLELYVSFLHCFGIKVGVKTDPKTSSFSKASFQSPSLFTNLEDNRSIADEVRLFTTSLSTLETMVGCRLLPDHLPQASVITKRYSKRLALHGIKAEFNVPGFRSAKQTIEELCQIRHDGSDKQIAALNLQQRFTKPFPKHFQNLICPEDCLSSSSAQIQTWTRYRQSYLSGFKPAQTDVFVRSSHLSLIKQTFKQTIPR